MKNYAETLDSYLIAEEGLFSKGELKALGIFAGASAALYGLSALILHRQHKQERSSAAKYNCDSSKYTQYTNLSKKYSSIKDFVKDYNENMPNNVWINTASLPKMTIYVEDLYSNISDDTEKILTQVYSQINEFRKFANGNTSGDNPHKDTMKKKILPVLVLTDVKHPSLLFQCDPDEGDFIAEVSNFAGKDAVRPKNDWSVSYSD